MNKRDIQKERKAFAECYIENIMKVDVSVLKVSKWWQDSIIKDNPKEWELFQETGCFCMGGRKEYERIISEVRT